MKPLQQYFHMVLYLVCIPESMDQILWSDHSTETSSTVHILERRIVYFSAFYQIKFAFFFPMLTLVTSGSELSRVNALQKL